jgi:hypothetical protein
MNTSTANTAEALQRATSSLDNLARAQAESLHIFQKEEADRGKKPRLALYIGHVALAQSHGPLRPREETDTSVTFDIVVRNVGEANADKVTWRALVPPDVSLTSAPPATLANDLPDRPVHSFLYFLDVFPSKGYVEATVTFIFPKGHPPFQVSFNASSAEMIGETPLGVLSIVPRTSSN